MKQTHSDQGAFNPLSLCGLTALGSPLPFPRPIRLPLLPLDPFILSSKGPTLLPSLGAMRSSLSPLVFT